ncbi:flagellar basal-body rod protein FlgF [Phenylobacterium sp.]|uniref:flagellar basal-body rod protein FlgF n=1 Tax=Phenylobacterium sp. TaxID=1871053 RepID=UPI0025EC640E|nr:flagellar basal-body rod protein FlgF [Phenylobacterium sp.]MCA6325611.1 flagellar basal-body rod protein FlgF [Phenylobacterium sp.]
MDNALYVGLSRQMTLRRHLDIVANNIANADTAGFKTEQPLIRTEPKAPARSADGPNPIKFVLDSGLARDFSQGALRTTSAAFDLAIDGPGFFRIQTPGGQRFTRDGHFRLDETGRIVTQSGQPVLDPGGAEVIIDPRNGPVEIARDGSISQGIEQVGRVDVVTFDSLSVLEKVGDNQFRNTSNAQPQPAPGSLVRQGMLEASNVNPILQVTDLIEVTRAYESLNRMMENTQDLSRRAVERLGRVE